MLFRSRRGEADLKKKENLFDCLLSFLDFVDDGIPHSRQGGEEKKKVGQILLFPGVDCGDVWTHASLVVEARGGDAPPLFLQF